MPVTGSTLIILTAAAIALLLVLILGVKLHAFLGLTALYVLLLRRLIPATVNLT